MLLIDSHAHLDFPQFDGDREAVIQRAQEAGLAGIVNVGASLASSRAAVRLAEKHSFIYATVGVHPHDAKDVTGAVVEQIHDLAQHPKVVAIGEIGLDYHRDLSPRPSQRRAFAQQLALAADLDLPVVIHIREAHDDVLAALRDAVLDGEAHCWKGTGVLHTYSGGLERLNEVLELGFLIGLSGPVTFQDAKQLRDVAARVPLDRLLIETDCPYLTPETHRGQRNEPAYVRYVAEAVARAREMPVKDVAEATARNANHLFGLP